MAAPAVFNCLPTSSERLFFLGTEFGIGYHKTAWCFQRERFPKVGCLLCPVMRMTKSEQTVQERSGVTRCLFLANREHSCTVTRHLERSSQLGCMLEPPTFGTQYCPLHFRTFTLTENLLQTLRSTVQSTSAILTSVKPGNCSLARFSQVGAKFLQ